MLRTTAFRLTIPRSFFVASAAQSASSMNPKKRQLDRVPGQDDRLASKWDLWNASQVVGPFKPTSRVLFWNKLFGPETEHDPFWEMKQKMVFPSKGVLSQKLVAALATEDGALDWMDQKLIPILAKKLADKNCNKCEFEHIVIDVFHNTFVKEERDAPDITCFYPPKMLVIHRAMEQYIQK